MISINYILLENSIIILFKILSSSDFKFIPSLVSPNMQLTILIRSFRL